jgi:cupin superfamily acireductone dioxygenase involved in methionine salvage
LHYHADEVFYVVEGEMEIYIHNQTVSAPMGSCVFAPRGIAHTFRNPNKTNAQPARVQFWSFPGGVEWYLEHASRALNQKPPNIDLFVRLAIEWGVEVIGPADWPSYDT